MKQMNSNEEFRANAAECERMADATKNPGDKRRWMKMAENWLRMIAPARPNASDRFDAAERQGGTHQAKSDASH
jgi:hypothetical protein